jgi:hypothetical protein
MLYWLGYELSDIQEAKAEFLGSRVDGREAPESETLTAYRDYDAALGRIATLVTDVTVFVVGNRSLSRCPGPSRLRNPP